MLNRLNRGDILLADSYFCSYFMIALLYARGVDVVFRQHQRRITNFRQGKHLGPQGPCGPLVETRPPLLDGSGHL